MISLYVFLRDVLVTIQSPEHPVQRMSGGTLLATRSTRPLSVEVERQRGDGFGQDTDAGVDGGHLHRRAFRHRLTQRRGRSEELGVRQRPGILWC